MGGDRGPRQRAQWRRSTWSRDSAQHRFSPMCWGFRDPANVRRSLREARGTGTLSWITSHSFRKTAATIFDEAAPSARLVADQLGHTRPSMTQDVYMARRSVDSQAALALEAALGPLDIEGVKGGKSVGKPSPSESQGR
jgi:integrase